jgi:hypothetical protein
MASFSQAEKRQDSSKIHVTKMSLQTFILPKSSPNKYPFGAEGRNFQKNIGRKSYSMNECQSASVKIEPEPEFWPRNGDSEDNVTETLGLILLRTPRFARK